MRYCLFLAAFFLITFLAAGCDELTREYIRADRSATLIVNKLDKEVYLDPAERLRVYELLRIELETIYREECR